MMLLQPLGTTARGLHSPPKGLHDFAPRLMISQPSASIGQRDVRLSDSWATRGQASMNGEGSQPGLRGGGLGPPPLGMVCQIWEYGRWDVDGGALVGTNWELMGRFWDKKRDTECPHCKKLYPAGSAFNWHVRLEHPDLEEPGAKERLERKAEVPAKPATTRKQAPASTRDKEWDDDF